MVDTVENALATPALEQPWVELGLTEQDYGRIREVLGRRPTGTELALYALMWSEQRSHQASAVHLGRFGPPGDGLVDVGGGRAVAFTFDRGVPTGPGDSVRNLLALGARPVAMLDALFLGPLDARDTASDLSGIVAGVGGHGHGLGVPIVGGEVVLDPVHAGNPLVTVMCVGVLEGGVDGPGPRPDDRVLLFGAESYPWSLLVECSLELVASGVVVLAAVGSGLVRAASVMAAAGLGLHLRQDATSSSQGMVAIVGPDDVEAVQATCATWGVDATDIGQVVVGGRLMVDRRGEWVVDVDPRTVVDAPALDRPAARPGWIDALNARRAEDLPRAASGAELGEQVLRLAGSPNLCDRSWVTDQYDRHARGDTVLAQPEDAGMVRLGADRGPGLAVSLDSNPRFCLLNPYLGAQLALGKAYRNVATTGALPLATATCLNVGPAEDSDVMWQLDESFLGLTEYADALGVPITDAVVGFNDPAGGGKIHPTPVVGVFGTIDDVADRTPMGFAHPGDAVVQLGLTREELSGSAWADAVHDHLGGMPPMPDAAAEKALGGVLVAAARQSLLSSAHDLAEGGLAQALVESTLRHGLGVSLTLPDGDATVHLFSESPARAIVSVQARHYPALRALCAEAGVPLERLGEVVDQPTIEVLGHFELPLDEVRASWEAPMRDAVGAR